MIVGQDTLTFDWIENWARIPDTDSGRENGRTHGVVVTKTGDVVVFCQADPAILIFGSDGSLKNQWGDRFLGAHGLTLVEENGTEYLWITDQDTAEVSKLTLDGQTVLSLDRAPHPIYETRKYIPTWVAVNEERFGGNGDIWVADGYGSFYVHRYDKSGAYVSSINGEEGTAGKFDCPHGLWADSRGGAPELLVADRGNKQFQVYAMDGTYKRAFGSEYMTSPDGCCAYGDGLLVPELFATVTIIDADDKSICDLGSNASVCKIEGWPNHDVSLIQAGRFNSPHGAAADADGNIYVVEWIIGGRITKLEKR